MQKIRAIPAREPRTTIYDVAEDAGVAISTVSRVLNNARDVSEATRFRVIRTIERLQYRPSRTAKMLAGKQLSTLAVAIPSFTTPAHNELLKGVREHLRACELDVLICDLGASRPYETLHRFMDRGAIQGLLLVGLPVNEKLVGELQSMCDAIVLIGARAQDIDHYYWDDAVGARAAVGHLIEEGHRRIAMISAQAASFSIENRQAGYRAALEAAGLPYDPALVVQGRTAKHAGYSEEAGYEAMQHLLGVEPAVTAVFAGSDVQAIGAWKAIRERGRSVPGDIALVGYDDIKVSAFLGLSTVDPHMHEIGRQATELLLRRLRGETSEAAVAVEFVPRFVPRWSSTLRGRSHRRITA